MTVWSCSLSSKLCPGQARKVQLSFCGCHKRSPCRDSENVIAGGAGWVQLSLWVSHSTESREASNLMRDTSGF